MNLNPMHFIIFHMNIFGIIIIDNFLRGISVMNSDNILLV